jgi:hypothetical protein
MPIDLSCPCGKRLRVAEEHAGRQGQCPVCGRLLNIPTFENADQGPAPGPPPLRLRPVEVPLPVPRENRPAGLPAPSAAEPTPPGRDFPTLVAPDGSGTAVARYQLYAPGAAALGCLFGSLMAGLVLIGINHRALGRAWAGAVHIFLGLLAGLVAVAVFRSYFKTPLVLIGLHGASVLAVYLLALGQQGAVYARHVQRGGAKAPAGRVAGICLLCLFGLAVVGIPYGIFMNRGGTVTFGLGEEVGYAGGVTRGQAQKFGDLLTEVGLFDGQGPKRVELTMEGDRYVVTCTLKDLGWEEPAVIAAFRALHGRLASEVFDGGPVIIRLCDQYKTSRRVITVGLGRRLSFGDGDEVYYTDGVTKTQAHQLGRKLQEDHFFNGTGARKVQLAREGPCHVVSVILRHGEWDDPQIVAYFQRLRRELEQWEFADGPVKICLWDQGLTPQRNFDP